MYIVYPTHYRAYCHKPSFPFGRRRKIERKRQQKKMSTLARTKPYSDNQIKLDFVAEVAGNSIRSPFAQAGWNGKDRLPPLRLSLLVVLRSNYKPSFEFSFTIHVTLVWETSYYRILLLLNLSRVKHQPSSGVGLTPVHTKYSQTSIPRTTINQIFDTSM